MFPIQANIFLQEMLDLATRVVRAVDGGMRLVEDAASVLSVHWKMVRRDAIYLEGPTYFGSGSGCYTQPLVFFIRR